MQLDKTYELNKSAVKSPKRQTYIVQTELPPLYSRYYRTCGRTAQCIAIIPLFGKSQIFQKHALWNFHTAHTRYFHYAVLPRHKRYECMAKRVTNLKARERPRCNVDRTVLHSRWICCSKSELSREYQPSDLNLKAHNPQQFGRFERSLQ